MAALAADADRTGAIAFFRDAAPGDREQHAVDLMAVDADGSDARVLVAHAAETNWCDVLRGPSLDLAWSPDGNRLAYVSAVGLFIVNADGSDPHRITTRCGESVDWSPRGDLLAMTTGSGIYVVRPDGTNGRYTFPALGHPECASSTPQPGLYATFSPSGDTIAVLGTGCPNHTTWGIYSYDVATGRYVTRYLDAAAQSTLAAVQGGLDWSAATNELLTSGSTLQPGRTCQVPGVPGSEYASYDPSVVPTAPGSTPSRVGNTVGEFDRQEFGAVWSPTGARMAFTASQTRCTPALTYERVSSGVWVQNRDGSGARAVYNGATSDSFPAVDWQPCTAATLQCGEPSAGGYVGVAPARLLETRTGPGLGTVDGVSAGVGVRPAGSTTELQVTGRAGIPADATSVVLNVAVVDAHDPGFVTVFPCGQPQPNAANLNYTTGQTIPNAVIATVDANGRVCLHTYGAVDLAVDVNGYHPADASYAGVSPARLLETRTGAGLSTIDGQFNGTGATTTGQIVALTVAGRANVPANAVAVTLNVTAIDARAPGFVTVFPCGETRPNAANVNYKTGQTIPNAVIAKVGIGGQICLYTYGSTDLSVDVAGYEPAGTSYTPLVPARLLETRSGTGLGTVDGVSAGVGVRAAGSTTELQVTGRAGIPSDATSVVLNVAVVDARDPGFVTVFPCGQPRPNAANLNYTTGQIIPNAVIATVGASGRVCLYTYGPVDLAVDVNGYQPL